jgi:hypothetical protein
MAWPGEQLLIRLWETLSDKGIGSLLKPGQIKRVGLASIEVDRAKALVDAQTQRDVEDIRLGRKEVSDFKLSLRFAGETSISSGELRRIEPTVTIESANKEAESRLLRDTIRHEINTANSIVYAEELLKDDTTVPPAENINDDWLYRWRDYTGNVSSDDLQRMWGKVLAGEVKAPGTYSLRCLDFLRNLSQEEAALIESMCSLVIDSFIWRPTVSYDLPIQFDRLLDLEELGLLTGVSSTGLSVTVTDDHTTHLGWIRPLVSNGKCLVVKNDNKSASLSIPVYTITRLGKQIIGLGSFNPNLTYLDQLGKYIVAIGGGFKVFIADVVEQRDDFVAWKGEKLVSTQV